MTHEREEEEEDRADTHGSYKGKLTPDTSAHRRWDGALTVVCRKLTLNI